MVFAPVGLFDVVHLTAHYLAVSTHLTAYFLIFFGRTLLICNELE